MKTTNLIVENIIVGLQVLTWLFIYALILTCDEMSDVVEILRIVANNKFKDLYLPLSFVVIAAAYTLGIITNISGPLVRNHESLDKLYRKFLLLANREFPEEVNDEHLLYVRSKESELIQELDRIKRTAALIGTTSFNLAVLFIMSAIFFFRFFIPEDLDSFSFLMSAFCEVISRADERPLAILLTSMLGVQAVLFVLVVTSMVVWIVLKKEYLEHVEMAYKIAKANSQGK